MDGLEVCSNGPRAASNVPYPDAHAKDSISDRVLVLEMGADDYLVKPFAFQELLARVHALLRRGPPAASQRFCAIRICDRRQARGWPSAQTAPLS